MADESTRGGANADFPRFKAGQSAADVLSASYQNKLISQIERLSQETFGPGANALVTGPCIFRKRKRAVASGGAAIVYFVIVTADCAEQTASAVVTEITCGTTDVSVGDAIDVTDVMGCDIVGAEDTLVGRRGVATKIEGGEYGCEWAIIRLCPDAFTC